MQQTQETGYTIATHALELPSSLSVQHILSELDMSFVCVFNYMSFTHMPLVYCRRCIYTACSVCSLHARVYTWSNSFARKWRFPSDGWLVFSIRRMLSDRSEKQHRLGKWVCRLLSPAHTHSKQSQENVFFFFESSSDSFQIPNSAQRRVSSIQACQDTDTRDETQ